MYSVSRARSGGGGFGERTPAAAAEAAVTAELPAITFGAPKPPFERAPTQLYRCIICNRGDFAAVTHPLTTVKRVFLRAAIPSKTFLACDFRERRPLTATRHEGYYFELEH